MMQTLSLENGKYELRFDEASGALCAYRYGEPWQDFTGNKFIYLLMQAALAAAEVHPVGEPVAWTFPGSDSIITAATKAYRGVLAENWTTPLYTAPPAQPAAQPLTDEQLLAIARDAAGGTSIKLTRDVGPYEVTELTHVYRCIARAIELAHGIGSQP